MKIQMTNLKVKSGPTWLPHQNDTMNRIAQTTVQPADIHYTNAQTFASQCSAALSAKKPSNPLVIRPRTVKT